MNGYRSILVLLCAATLSSCGKEAFQDITSALPGSQVRFFNFSLNAPGVNFWANDAKVTGVLSSTGVESTTGTVYGGVGSGGLYSAIEPGTYALSARISATTDKDVAITTLQSAVANGKAYSYFTSGVYNTTAKSSDSFIVEDPIPEQFDYSTPSVRFVHAIHNANPMTLYAKNTTTLTEYPVGGAVQYKAAGAFTAIPQGVYDLSTRYAGSTTNVITRTAVSFSVGRVYTIGARGDITITSTTATNRPFLDNTANR